MPAESTLTPNLDDLGLGRYWEPMTEEEGCRATCGHGDTILLPCSSTQVGIRLHPSCPVPLTSLGVAQVPASQVIP